MRQLFAGVMSRIETVAGLTFDIFRVFLAIHFCENAE